METRHPKPATRNRKKTRLVLIGALIIIGAAAYVQARSSPTLARAWRARTVPTPDPQVVAAHTAFGLDLFQRLAAAKPRQNVFLSGPSAAMVLSMIANGAVGDTQAGMEKALHTTGLGMDRVNEANRAVRLGLRAWDPKLQVQTANAAWTDDAIKPTPQFRTRMRDLYGAEIAPLDLQSPAAISTINGWVKSNTGGKIDRLVESLDPNSAMILASAIYFHGEWQEKFERSETRDEPFIHLDGSRVPLPMMRQTHEFPYIAGDGFQAIALPYGDGRMSMVILLPNETDGLPALMKTLTPEKWAAWIARLQPEEKEIILPRFRIADDNTLDDALKAMGMALAYTPGAANFTGMASVNRGDLWLSTVRQKALLEVDEEGSTAAAATYGEMTTAAAPMPLPYVRVDHPFLCAIRDNETGEVLFMGAIYDPESM